MIMCQGTVTCSQFDLKWNRNRIYIRFLSESRSNFLVHHSLFLLRTNLFSSKADFIFHSRCQWNKLIYYIETKRNPHKYMGKTHWRKYQDRWAIIQQFVPINFVPNSHTFILNDLWILKGAKGCFCYMLIVFQPPCGLLVCCKLRLELRSNYYFNIFWRDKWNGSSWLHVCIYTRTR